MTHGEVRVARLGSLDKQAGVPGTSPPKQTIGSGQAPCPIPRSRRGALRGVFDRQSKRLVGRVHTDLVGVTVVVKDHVTARCTRVAGDATLWLALGDSARERHTGVILS